MNKEAVTNYAIKKMVSSAFPQEPQRPIELVEQPKKKYWWSKQAKPQSILSPEEQRILKKVKSRAHFLDRGLTCCCFQIGFDGLVGKKLKKNNSIHIWLNYLFRANSCYW
jgi:hypothetical protein